jgi:hypothetical protein
MPGNRLAPTKSSLADGTATAYRPSA